MQEKVSGKYFQIGRSDVSWMAKVGACIGSVTSIGFSESVRRKPLELFVYAKDMREFPRERCAGVHSPTFVLGLRALTIKVTADRTVNRKFCPNSKSLGALGAADSFSFALRYRYAILRRDGSTIALLVRGIEMLCCVA